jgi:anhydro-N-acetylmuramic acid kinase
MAEPTGRLIVGAMSGTSADGVDVAMVRVTGRGADMRAALVAHRHTAYTDELRRLIFSMRGGDAAVRLADVARCTREVSLAYAEAVNGVLGAAGVAAEDVAAVAAHGQTVFHAPPDTVQLFDPSLLAARTNCPVVSDFRRADCAAGGQGAPLVPFADFVLFRSTDVDRIVVNIGGIANVTCLFRASPTLDRVIAFDTGPGNCISDHLMRRHDPAGPGCDVGGARALQGRISRLVFDAVRLHPWFEKLGPKSTDGPEMVGIFEAAVREYDPDLSLEDQLATAAAIVAMQINRASALFGGQFHGELIVSGGGVRNRAIMDQIAYWFRRDRIRTTDELGVLGEAKEAIAFALLAAATLDGLPANVPSATGAERPVVLGSITPRP